MHSHLQISGFAPRALAAALIAAWTLPSAAQDTTPDTARELDSVIVTGTRSATRTVTTSESPIDVISARDLQSTGSSELATALSRLVPSLNFPRPAVTDASDAVRPAQLRGLSPDQTLVLVDGKRRHAGSVVNVSGSQGRGSAPVDLNAIPIDAIERIEVLRDGAAAQYGSDAIAGVINIILKKRADGGLVRGDASRYDAGDGFARTLAAHAGFALGEAGAVQLTLEDRRQDFTNRAGADLRDPTEPRYGQVNQRLGDPDSRQQALFLNSRLGVADGIELYAFGGLSDRRTSAAATWRTAQTAVGSGTLRTPLYPEGFLPIEASRSRDQSLVAGVRHDSTDGWRWDLSVNHGDNRFELDVENSVNLSLGATSPTSFNAGGLKNSQTLVNLDAARDFDLGLANPVTLALGAEARNERYTIDAGEPNSYTGSGAQGFPGFRPENAGTSSRRSQSLYVNLETEFSKQLSGAFALRREHYSDFGDATSAKLAGRFVATEGVTLRATASTGFRAPSLAQQNYTITTTNFIVIDGVNTPIETGTFAVGSPAAQALGATPLKAEKSRNLSVGLVLQPARNLTATVDAYQIDIDDRVLFSGNLVLPTALQSQLGVGAARYFTNAIDTRTRGIDVVGTWRIDIAEATRADVTLGYNHTRTTVRSVAPNPAVLTQNNLKLVDDQSIGRATQASPDSKLSLGTELVRGGWSARATATRYGEFTVPQNNAALNQTYAATWTLDIAGSLKLAHWTFTLGADNVTDRYPDEITSAGNLNTNGIFRYSNFSPYGFNGRSYYAKAAYAW